MSHLPSLRALETLEAVVRTGNIVSAADDLCVTPGAVTQLVAGLTEAGLVVQARDPGDGRRRVLALAQEWAERVAGFEGEVVRQLAPRFDALDDAEVATLAGLLHRTAGAPS